MEDLIARIMEVDTISLWLVIMMSAAGAYYLSYTFTGMFAAAAPIGLFTRAVAHPIFVLFVPFVVPAFPLAYARKWFLPSR